MAQSPEYPDLPWMPPKSWTNANRGSVQLIVIHTTEGSAHGQSAEDGAAYDQRRTDGTSTHYFHDSDSTVQCVVTEDQAHTARTQGNKRGIQHELCTRGGSANWNDSYHQAMLRRAATQCARDALKWGIPVDKLTSSEVAAGVKGFCGHADVTKAFPADGGTHTDPGSSFPWSSFLAMVNDQVYALTDRGSEMNDEDRKWMSAEIRKIVNEVVVNRTEWTDDLGGLKSGAGQAVLEAGYPRVPGEDRKPTWSNLSKDSQVIDRIETKLDALAEVLGDQHPPVTP